MNNELEFSNEEGLLADGELDTIAGGGAAAVLKAIGKKFLGPIGFIWDMLEAKPAY